MSKWNITKLITASSLSVVYLILALSGGAITAITGVPGAGGITNIFVSGLMFAICCLIIRKFWAATVMGIIFGILVLPLTLLGTLGFVPKIAIAGIAGIVADSLFFALRRMEKLAAIIISLVCSLLTGFLIFGFTLLFGIPGASKMGEMWLNPIGITISIVLAALPGYVAYLIYKKLENTTTLRRIQA